MSSAQDIKNAMEACQKGIKVLEARVATNSELVKARDTSYNEWRASKDAHQTNCNNEREERNRKREEWETNFNNEKNARKGDTEHHDGACGSFRGCSSGFYETEYWYDAGSWKCNRKCRRRDEDAERIARDKYGNKPGEYECQPFPEEEPGQAQLDTTPITVGCCANSTNIIGSDLQDVTITQQNSCLSNLQNEYDKKKKDEEANVAAKAETNRVAAPEPAADKAAADKNKRMLIIAAIVLVCCCLLSCVACIIINLD